MADVTPRIKLRRPVDTDFVTYNLDLNDNHNALDAAIDRVFTSTTRPATPYVGMMGFETDTKRRVIWDGTIWRYPDIVPIANVTERNALAVYEGLRIYRIDKAWEETYASGAWRILAIQLVDALANVPNPYNNQIVILGEVLKRWNGTAWVDADAALVARVAAIEAITTTPVKPWRCMYNDSAFSVPNAAVTTVTGWIDETGAPTNANSEITYSNGVFTVARDGRYLISLSLGWSVGSTITGRFSCRLNWPGGTVKQGSINKTSSVAEFVVPQTTFMVPVSSGGTILTEAFQDSGAARPLVSGATGRSMSFVSISYEGPL